MVMKMKCNFIMEGGSAYGNRASLRLGEQNGHLFKPTLPGAVSSGVMNILNLLTSARMPIQGGLSVSTKRKPTGRPGRRIRPLGENPVSVTNRS